MNLKVSPVVHGTLQDVIDYKTLVMSTISEFTTVNYINKPKTTYSNVNQINRKKTLRKARSKI